MVGSVFASGVRAHVFGETVGTGTHAYPSEVSLSVQHAAVRAPRSSKLPSNNHNASPAPYFNSSEPQRGAQGMKDAGTGCDADVSQFKAQFKDLFTSTTGRYAKAAWQHAIAAAPEGEEYRPVTDLVTHESVSSRYGPSEVSIEPSQNRSTTPTLPRPGLSAAISYDRAVRRPIVEAVPSSAAHSDAVTQTICEASAQTVEEEPEVFQDRVIRVPWGGRPDGATPVIVPVSEAKALASCAARTTRAPKKGNTPRKKKAGKPSKMKQDKNARSASGVGQTVAEKRVLKDRNSDSLLLPPSLRIPLRQSAKSARVEPGRPRPQRPRSANAAVGVAVSQQHAFSANTAGSHSALSPARCAACGACNTECPQSAVASPSRSVHESPKALQPVPLQPSTPGPTAAALAPSSPPKQCIHSVLSYAPGPVPSLPLGESRGIQQVAPVAPVAQPVNHSALAWQGYASNTATDAPPTQPHVDKHQKHSATTTASAEASSERREPVVLLNPERQDMVTQLEKALADLERDVSQRASEISSVTVPVFNSGLDSLAALEAEISDQHRRLADIGVLLPADKGKSTALGLQPDISTQRSGKSSPDGSIGAMSSILQGMATESHCTPPVHTPKGSWQRQDDSSSEGMTAIINSDSQSSVSQQNPWPHAQPCRTVASSVSGSGLPSFNEGAAAVPYLMDATVSRFTSECSDSYAPQAARTSRSHGRSESRPQSASPDGVFSTVSIEDRLTRMGLSEQISQLVRDISAETDSVCSMPQSTQDSFPWLRGVTTNSDTSSTVTLPPLAPPQPLLSRDCLRPSSASPDALSDGPSSSMASRDLGWRSLSASGTYHEMPTSADPNKTVSPPSPSPLANELTFAPGSLGAHLHALSTRSEESSTPASSPTVANSMQPRKEAAAAYDKEPPFQQSMRDLLQQDRHLHQGAEAVHPCNESAFASSRTDANRDTSPDRASRASSARSASLNPAATSSWRGTSLQGNSEDRESLTSRSISPELSTTHSERTPEQAITGRDLSFVSPATASDLGDSTSMTATPTDLVADVDSILCTSFWAS